MAPPSVRKTVWIETNKIKFSMLTCAQIIGPTDGMNIYEKGAGHSAEWGPTIKSTSDSRHKVEPSVPVAYRPPLLFGSSLLFGSCCYSIRLRRRDASPFFTPSPTMLTPNVALTVLLAAVGIQGPGSCPAPTVAAQEKYAGVRHSGGTVSRLRIGNGGAGQSGLVKALSQAYIDYSRDNGLADQDYLVRSVRNHSLGHGF
jgi:hypothetical protein